MKSKIYTLTSGSIFQRVNTPVVLGIVILFLLIIRFSDGFGNNFYSKANGEWTDSNVWGTDSCGDKGSTGVFPGAGDNVYIRDGHVITISDDVSCENIFVGSGNSGILQFGFNQNATLTIAGNITVNKGALVQYDYNSSKRHIIKLYRNFLNMGDVRLRFDGDDYVSIQLLGDEPSLISGQGKWSGLACLSMNKNNRNVSVQINSIGFGEALTSGAATISAPKPAGKNPPVIFICGTFIYNIPDQLSNLINPGATGDPSFTINQNVTIQIEQGTLDMGTYPGIGSMGNCILEGALIINGGKVTISKNTASDWNVGLFYCSAGNNVPKLAINGGTVLCYGAFTTWTSGNDHVDFSMKDGVFKVNMGPVSTKMEAFWITDNPASAVSFTGGTVVIQNRSTFDDSLISSDFLLGGSNTDRFKVSETAYIQMGDQPANANQALSYLDNYNADRQR